jgi:hypothetical protein
MTTSTMDPRIVRAILSCLDTNIGECAMVEGLDVLELGGTSPVGLCAEFNNNDWGAFDRLSDEHQQKWIRKAKNKNRQTCRFWIRVFECVPTQVPSRPCICIYIPVADLYRNLPKCRVTF